jgi:transcriptional activator HAC1
VLRNRQAAQSSRERKRQEVEKLEGEKYAIERQNYLLKQRLLAVEHEKFALRQQLAKLTAALQNKGMPSPLIANVSTPSSPSLLAAEMHQLDKTIKQEFEDLSFSLPSPQNTLGPASSFSTPASSPSRSPSPAQFNNNVRAKSSDMTQHPAVMLCGLQCQSEAAWRPLKSHPLALEEVPSLPLQLHRQMAIPHLHTILHLFLTIHSVVCSNLLQPLSQLLISLRKGIPMPTSKMTPTLFSLILWLISTPVNPINPMMSTVTSSHSTSMINTTKITSTFSPPRSLPLAFRTSLLRRLLACSPALARPLKDATGRALQMKTSYALCGNADDRPVVRHGVDMASSGEDSASWITRDAVSRQTVWQLKKMILVINRFIRQRKLPLQPALGKRRRRDA